MPSPEFEIYVYAPEIEGIHLRGGKIARGGIRFSDRMDYRTEVYGLMRAQLTKNAIIVPAGAKGGFIVKKTPIDKEAIQQAYVTYIRSLLDVTDNLVDGEVVQPERVRVRDEDDTYLVVAADKGTATFSDTANAIAREYGFWLDDAFASGGSVGYDHKKLGITARGAWESVKRHFRELGMDPARDEFTVVGIGDMSGDVFGNGMLLSDKIKLLAAYDHRHVFIDPDPDPATSFAERKRLFEKPGSSWADYSALSEGGGVYPRDAKWIELSDRARELLGIEEERGRRRTTSSARSCARRSTCCGTAASGRWSRPRRRATPTRPTARATRSGSTRATCAAAWWGRAATSASRAARGSSTRPAAGSSTPTSSTTRPASTARTTRSTSRSCSGWRSAAGR